MKILLTGASSFTGMWFAEALVRAGHEVTATLRGKDAAAYADPIRRARVERVQAVCEVEYGCSFGDARFVELCTRGRFDVLCHHGADATNYRSPDFDVTAAVASNCAGLRRVLEVLGAHGCRRVVLTGSVFEGGEGAGSQHLPHFSPYGLSKALTSEVFRYFVRAAGLSLGKFVIPNPFGPFEEPRFTAYLVRSWYAGETPMVKTPDYVRDNIHVGLLSAAYVRFVETLSEQPGFERMNPSGYVESQGAFARRFARELRGRLGLACEVAEAAQTEFSEPMIRINTESLSGRALAFDESAAWDALAAHYVQRFGPARA